MRIIKEILILILIFCFVSPSLKAKMVAPHQLANSKEFKKTNSSQQQIGKWLFTIVERDLEFNIDGQEKVVVMEKLLNLPQSALNFEEEIVWFSPRDKGIHLYHNNIIGVGLNKTDNGINFVSLFDLDKGIELLNRSNTSIFKLMISSSLLPILSVLTNSIFFFFSINFFSLFDLK